SATEQMERRAHQRSRAARSSRRASRRRLLWLDASGTCGVYSVAVLGAVRVRLPAGHAYVPAQRPDMSTESRSRAATSGVVSAVGSCLASLLKNGGPGQRI